MRHCSRSMQSECKNKWRIPSGASCARNCRRLYILFMVFVSRLRRFAVFVSVPPCARICLRLAPSCGLCIGALHAPPCPRPFSILWLCLRLLSPPRFVFLSQRAISRRPGQIHMLCGRSLRHGRQRQGALRPVPQSHRRAAPMPIRFATILRQKPNTLAVRQAGR